MAVSLSQTLLKPETHPLPVKWIAALLALGLTPALAFLYLQERRCAARYLMLNGLVFGLGGTFAFMGYEQFTTGLLLFCNFALVGVPGAAHVNAYSLENRAYGKRPFCSTLLFVLSLPVIASLSLYALSTRLQFLHVANTSMVPTLAQDAPYLLDRLRLAWREPRRGDIIAFSSRSSLGEVTRISRIIGLPGDRIGMHAGRPVLNGRPLLRETVTPYDPKTGHEPAPATRFVEILPDGTAYGVAKSLSDGAGSFDHRPEVTVLPGSYFVLGDNRDVARDSRDNLQVGLVRRADIIGNVIPLRMPEDAGQQPAGMLGWLKKRLGLAPAKADPA